MGETHPLEIAYWSIFKANMNIIIRAYEHRMHAHLISGFKYRNYGGIYYIYLYISSLILYCYSFLLFAMFKFSVGSNWLILTSFPVWPLQRSPETRGSRYIEQQLCLYIYEPFYLKIKIAILFCNILFCLKVYCTKIIVYCF